jgi:hypothetical protein
LQFFLFGSDADLFFDFGIFNDAKVQVACAPEGAVDAVLLGFQLLLWELVYLKTLLSNVYCPLLQKGENAPAFLCQKEWVCYSGYTDGLQFFFIHSERFPNVKYKKK